MCVHSITQAQQTVPYAHNLTSVNLQNFKKCLEEWYPPPYRFLPSGKAVHFSRRKATVEVPTDIVEGWKIVPDIQPCEVWCSCRILSTRLPSLYTCI